MHCCSPTSRNNKNLINICVAFSSQILITLRLLDDKLFWSKYYWWYFFPLKIDFISQQRSVYGNASGVWSAMLHFTFCISYFVLSFYYFVFYSCAKISFWEHLWSPCYLPSGIGEKWSFVLIRANLPTNISTYTYYIYMLLFIYMQLFTWHVSPIAYDMFSWCWSSCDMYLQRLVACKSTVSLS